MPSGVHRKYAWRIRGDVIMLFAVVWGVGDMFTNCRIWRENNTVSWEPPLVCIQKQLPRCTTYCFSCMEWWDFYRNPLELPSRHKNDKYPLLLPNLSQQQCPLAPKPKNHPTELQRHTPHTVLPIQWSSAPLRRACSWAWSPSPLGLRFLPMGVSTHVSALFTSQLTISFDFFACCNHNINISDLVSCMEEGGLYCNPSSEFTCCSGLICSQFPQGSRCAVAMWRRVRDCYLYISIMNS